MLYKIIGANYSYPFLPSRITQRMVLGILFEIIILFNDVDVKYTKHNTRVQLLYFRVYEMDLYNSLHPL